MEDVCAVYCRDLDPKRPVICMDESPKPLIGETRKPLEAKPGMVKKVDDEYVRNGVSELFLALEPLTGHLIVDVTETRTKIDWAHFIKHVVDDEYPNAEKIILVMDNLNTHKISSLYEAFPPEEAFRIAQKLECHYTPKHGSWLNVAEMGFSLLKRQCLPDRVDNIDELRKQVNAYVSYKNAQKTTIDWQFKVDGARTKLRHIYPEL